MKKIILLFILMGFTGLQFIKAQSKTDLKLTGAAESIKAVESGEGSLKKIIFTPLAPAPVGPYSQGYLSGC
jgi:hypothetical protein